MEPHRIYYKITDTHRPTYCSYLNADELMYLGIYLIRITQVLRPAVLHYSQLTPLGYSESKAELCPTLL